jgi:hypothetical protein
MSISKTEELEGVGDVYELDSILFRAQYDLTVVQRSDGQGEKEGSIAIHPDSDKVTGKVWDLDELFHHKSQKKLTLQLEDGRSLDFFLIDNRGNIRGTGGLYRPLTLPALFHGKA